MIPDKSLASQLCNSSQQNPLAAPVTEALNAMGKELKRVFEETATGSTDNEEELDRRMKAAKTKAIDDCVERIMSLHTQATQAALVEPERLIREILLEASPSELVTRENEVTKSLAPYAS